MEILDQDSAESNHTKAGRPNGAVRRAASETRKIMPAILNKIPKLRAN